MKSSACLESRMADFTDDGLYGFLQHAVDRPTFRPLLPGEPGFSTFSTVRMYGDLVYRTHRTDTAFPNGIIRIHSGFITDGASVPSLFWFLVPAWWTMLMPGVVHDYLIRTQAARPGTRWANDRIADAIFAEACQAMGVGRFKSNGRLWSAVRIGSITRYLFGGA